MTQGPDGLVRIALERPFADGTIALDLAPLSLLCRLAVSVPIKGTHPVRYAGVLASARGVLGSASKLRAHLALKPTPTATAWRAWRTSRTCRAEARVATGSMTRDDDFGLHRAGDEALFVRIVMACSRAARAARPCGGARVRPEATSQRPPRRRATRGLGRASVRARSRLNTSDSRLYLRSGGPRRSGTLHSGARNPRGRPCRRRHLESRRLP